MAISASEVIPLSQARANFSELAEDVRGRAKKIIIKNGEAVIALIDEASKGLDDVAAGRVQDARNALQTIKSCRSTSD